MTSINKTTLTAFLGLSALAFGCTSAPPQATAQEAAVSSGCSKIGAEIKAAEEVKRTAQAQQADAWKAVVPVAVAARFAKSKAAVQQVDQRIAQLQADFKRKGCTT